MEPKSQVEVFLSYGREDQLAVERIYAFLESAGLKPWMDVRDIFGGEDYKKAIWRALRKADFLVMCLSSSTAAKRGFLQKEIRRALDTWKEKLSSDIYLIVVRLDDCQVPEDLEPLQYLDFPSSHFGEELIEAITEGCRRVGIQATIVEPLYGILGSDQVSERYVNRYLKKRITTGESIRAMRNSPDGTVAADIAWRFPWKSRFALYRAGVQLRERADGRYLGESEGWENSGEPDEVNLVDEETTLEGLRPNTEYELRFVDLNYDSDDPSSLPYRFLTIGRPGKG